MLVEGTGTLVAFAIFVAPGAFWLWRAENRRAVANRSQLMEAAIVTLASTVFSTPALLATGVSLWAVDHDLSTLAVWRNPMISPSGDLVLAYAALWLVELGTAIGLAELVFRRWGERLLGPLQARPVSAWTVAFRSCKPDATVETMVEVLLDDDSIVRGIVEDYTPDHQLDDRELVIASPICHERDGKSVFDNRPPPHRLIITAKSIRSLAVRYIQSEDLAALRNGVDRG